MDPSSFYPYMVEVVTAENRSLFIDLTASGGCCLQRFVESHGHPRLKLRAHAKVRKQKQECQERAARIRVLHNGNTNDETRLDLQG
jgi:hypothetical protein